ncbi:hypothetical protein INR49_011969 [Caranx melampygus]|nr:hypothetical protein INR49_011969 [Caranx melampygus]
MDYSPHTPPPVNSSSSSSSLLCPTAATTFFLPSAYSLLFLTALPGNVLSLWVFLRCISTTSSIHVYLCHLSISNLLMSITTPFLAAYYARGSAWTVSSVLCQLVVHGITPVLHINIYISLMILTWVALSRFATLIQRTHASRPSLCKTLLPSGFFTSLKKASFARWVCVVVWMAALASCVPVAVYYSVNEAMSATTAAGGGGSGEGVAEVAGSVEMCYSPAVEIGGSLSAELCFVGVAMFFLFYLLVLLSYMAVLKHIRRSRQSTTVTTSQSLLGRVLRNIVVIQVVLSVCLLPYHVFKPIFITLAHHQMMDPAAANISGRCHPLSALVELKNCLFLLAALRGSTDPVMYFLLDKTFRRQTLVLFKCSSRSSSGAKGGPGQKAGQTGDGNTVTATAESSHHMDYSPHTPPPVNSSSSLLCPTAATTFFLPSAYSLLFLTALPGNVLSLWVFLRCISTTSSIHVYLCHLSISNLLMSITTPFLAAYYARGSAWTVSSVLCQLVVHGITPVLHINIYISLMILTWVALSRFATLIQRTHASRPSLCKTLLPSGFFTSLKKASFARWVCVVVWLVTLAGCVPVTVYYSVNEAMSATTAADGGEGVAEVAGSEEMCYSPAVEIGGSLSAELCFVVITMFFLFYLLVLLSYMAVLKHIRRSRQSTTVTTSQSLLGRVLRNIVVIQVVLSVCLLPYHVFKPIFITLALRHHQMTDPAAANISGRCHPLSALVELKNCLFLLAALRGSTDPVMYFLLDKTFRRQTLVLFKCSSRSSSGAKGGPGQKAGQTGDGNTVTATAESSRDSVL